MRPVFSAILVAICWLALVLLVTPDSVDAAAATTIWEHFPYDADVTTSNKGYGPSQATLVGTGPVVADNPRFGAGSATNQNPGANGYVRILYNRTASWSFALWLQPVTLIASNTQVLVPESDGEFDFQLVPGPLLQFIYRNGVVSNFGGTPAPKGQWTHFAVTGTDQGNGNINIIEYVNGGVAQSYTQATAPPSLTNIPYAVMEGGNYYIDELWIVNSAISQNQVQEVYSSNVLNA